MARRRGNLVTIEVEIDPADYDLVEIDKARDVPPQPELERLIGLAEEAARRIRAADFALALSIDDSISRCRKSMKIE